MSEPQTLTQYLEWCVKNAPRATKFVPNCQRCAASGDIVAYVKQCGSQGEYGKWVDHNLTVMLDAETKEVIGYRIASPEWLLKMYSGGKTLNPLQYTATEVTDADLGLVYPEGSELVKDK